MTKEDFMQYLTHPENMNGSSISDLEKLVKEYPYFQSARLLFLKTLHNEKSIEYEKNLHITSAYVSSGKVLYNLIKKKPVIKKDSEVMPPSNKEKNLSFIGSKEVEEKKQDDFAADDYTQFDKEMLREAYRTSVAVDFSGELSGQHTPSVQIKKPTDIKQGNYSFADWLKIIHGEIPASVEEEKVAQRKKQTELIDQFILDDISKPAVKPKTEFYSAESMAKRSLLDDETFVSETLAGIYLKQGNLPKAQRAYEILIVKHPEKIHIFAPLLEKIKKLQHDSNR